MIALAYSRDGTRLAAAGTDRNVRIWDLDASRPPLVLSDMREGLASVAFSPDGNVLATGGGAPPAGDPGTGRQIPGGRGRGTDDPFLESDAPAVQSASFEATSVRSMPSRSAPMAADSRPPAPTGSSGSGIAATGEMRFALEEQRECSLQRGVQPGWHAIGFRRGRPDHSLLGCRDRALDSHVSRATPTG